MTGALTVPGPFSYEALLSDQAEVAKNAAERIRDRARRRKEDLIQTGHDLSDVKEALGHGAFGAWLHHEFDLTERTAQQYMHAARWYEKNSELGSVLRIEAIYELSAKNTPQSAVQDVQDRICRGERMTAHEVRTIVRMQKRESSEARKIAMKKKERVGRKRRETRKKRFESERAELAEQPRLDQAEALRIVDILLDNLSESELVRVFKIFTNGSVRWKAQAMLTGRLQENSTGSSLTSAAGRKSSISTPSFKSASVSRKPCDAAA